MLDSVNPFKDRELRAYDGSLIVVDARFLRISRESLLENIMVIFEDKSGIRAAERKLDEERERYDAELEAIAAILKNGPLLFKDFIAEGEALAAELSASLENLSDPERSAYFMRQFHSLKGSALFLQLAQLATSAHRIEDLLLAARETGGLGSEQLQAIGKSLESTKEGIRNIKESIERFSAFQGGGDTSPQRELEASASSFADMVGQLGRELGKEAVFKPVVKMAALPFLRELKNPIIHLLRNSMDHGLEDIYERTASGKPSAGRIRLEIGKEGREIRIAVQDDGRGIDFEQIR
jgi:chemotaxis protein histidine kinase CheA